jgi:hypothetical protein
MGPWLRVGRRLEWTLVAFTALMLILVGLRFMSRAPVNMRWMAWIYIGGFFGVMLTFSLLLVQSLRRRGIIPGSSGR